MGNRVTEGCLKCQPLCRKEAVLAGDCYRISVLTPALVRLEYSPEGIFEDRATQVVINRDFPVPEFQVKETERELVLFTECLELHYDRGPFTAEGLFIRTKGAGSSGAAWHYGQEPEDLGGTARTLDKADGPVPLGHGLLSRKGYSLIDDSRSMILQEDGWIAPRKEGIADLYFLGYGHAYLRCLRDFYQLCGRTPLLPRYALGNWWSRFHPYTQEEYQGLMERFAGEGIPFTVAVIDMDWHLWQEVDPKYGSGWTGYTWNRKLFPEPERFLQWLHAHGMKTALNVHPADGVRAYEEPYDRVANAMGIDPASGEPVEFDPTDPHFMEVYLKELHHPMEREGVDFWWLDWQQGTSTRIPGLDPLWMLNHYHYLDSGWKGTRSLTFSRYAGLGSHRYPIGFSGDTVISWASLKFQCYFTATASNVGYGWWSHDIGGHMNGARDEELMTRWLQFGVFSPINRLHSTRNRFNGKEPWNYDAVIREILERYLRLRHSLIPYLYTMNRRASREGLPLLMPLYYLEPERSEAYQAPEEYYFGSELLAAPVTEPQDPVGKAAKVRAWLPEGLWADFFTGLVYEGGRFLKLWRGLEDLPVLMKAGAIVPMRDSSLRDNSLENPGAMEVRIFPAADGAFTLWEDAGDTPEDLEENWAYTNFSVTAGEKGCFVVEGAKGNLSVIPENRSWRLVFVGTGCGTPAVYVKGFPAPCQSFYEAETESLVVEIPRVPVEAEIRAEFPEGMFPAEGAVEERCYRILDKSRIAYDLKQALYEAIEKSGRNALGAVLAYEPEESVLGQLAEILTSRNA